MKFWMDDENNISTEKLKGAISFHADALTLCEGRHKTPCKQYLFSEKDTVNPMDFERMEGVAEDRIRNIFPKLSREGNLVIYVTGLTPALIAAINALIEASLYTCILLAHYDKKTGGYKAQNVNLNIG